MSPLRFSILQSAEPPAKSSSLLAPAPGEQAHMTAARPTSELKSSPFRFRVPPLAFSSATQVSISASEIQDHGGQPTVESESRSEEGHAASTNIQEYTYLARRQKETERTNSDDSEIAAKDELVSLTTPPKTPGPSTIDHRVRLFSTIRTVPAASKLISYTPVAPPPIQQFASLPRFRFSLSSTKSPNSTLDAVAKRSGQDSERIQIEAEVDIAAVACQAQHGFAQGGEIDVRTRSQRAGLHHPLLFSKRRGKGKQAVPFLGSEILETSDQIELYNVFKSGEIGEQYDYAKISISSPHHDAEILSSQTYEDDIFLSSPSRKRRKLSPIRPNGRCLADIGQTDLTPEGALLSDSGAENADSESDENILEMLLSQGQDSQPRLKRKDTELADGTTPYEDVDRDNFLPAINPQVPTTPLPLLSEKQSLGVSLRKPPRFILSMQSSWTSPFGSSASLMKQKHTKSITPFTYFRQLHLPSNISHNNTSNSSSMASLSHLFLPEYILPADWSPSKRQSHPRQRQHDAASQKTLRVTPKSTTYPRITRSDRQDFIPGGLAETARSWIVSNLSVATPLAPLAPLGTNNNDTKSGKQRKKEKERKRGKGRGDGNGDGNSERVRDHSSPEISASSLPNPPNSNYMNSQQNRFRQCRVIRIPSIDGVGGTVTVGGAAGYYTSCTALVGTETEDGEEGAEGEIQRKYLLITGKKVLPDANTEAKVGCRIQYSLPWWDVNLGARGKETVRDIWRVIPAAHVEQNGET